MCRQNLPNYHKYWERLNNFANTLGIKIEYAENDSEGSFSQAHRKIRVDVGLCEAEDIATILHELGHAMDTLLVTPTISKHIEKAYEVVYNRKPTRRQQSLVMGCEKRAWLYGRSIAKQLKIRLGKWYFQFERDCLKSYEDT